MTTKTEQPGTFNIQKIRNINLKKLVGEYKKTGKGMAKILRLLRAELRGMNESGYGIAVQREMIEALLNVKFEYITFYRWHKRNFPKNEAVGGYSEKPEAARYNVPGNNRSTGEKTISPAPVVAKEKGNDSEEGVAETAVRKFESQDFETMYAQYKLKNSKKEN